MLTGQIGYAADEASIRGLIEKMAVAVRAKNLDGVWADYAPEFLLFDLHSTLQDEKLEIYRQKWEDCLPVFQGPIHYEVRDLSVSVGEDVAFSHSLTCVGGDVPGAGKIEHWMRETTCFRKVNGRWLIAHAHISAPAELETGLAMLGLKPE